MNNLALHNCGMILSQRISHNPRVTASPRPRVTASPRPRVRCVSLNHPSIQQRRKNICYLGLSSGIIHLSESQPAGPASNNSPVS